MTGIDLDLAGVRARAEMFASSQPSVNTRAVPTPPPTVIAMLDLIERQAGEIEQLKAEVAALTKEDTLCQTA